MTERMLRKIILKGANLKYPESTLKCVYACGKLFPLCIFVVANMLSYVKLQLLKWNFVWTCKYFSLRLCKHVYKCAKSLTFWVVCINEYATFGLKSALRLTAYIKQKITSMKFHPSVPSLCLSVFPHLGLDSRWAYFIVLVIIEF